MEKLDAKAAERAFSMCNVIDETIDDVRSIAVRLRPGVLDDLGLIPALEWFTADFEKRTGITCVFEHSHVPAVNDVIATAAYRITQEALTNVVRHASAKSVHVTLRMEDGSLILEVNDEGCGFDVTRLEDSESLGIAGMRERAALVGGSLEIRSRKAAGTHIFCRIPLDGSNREIQ
jgi:signal transduction histidine kinase